MIFYVRQELEGVLDALGIRQGDILMVQSALLDLGLMRGTAPAALPAAIHDTIRNRVGPQGTICAQSFTFGSCRGELFDPEVTAASTGVFAEYLRQSPGTLRSPHPIQSVVANGPAAAAICRSDTASGYAIEGPYGRLLDLDAKLLLLGRRNVDTASYAHYVEEQVGVPYRYWKQYVVPYRRRGVVQLQEYRMLVRDLALAPVIDIRMAVMEMERNGVLSAYPLGGSVVRVASVRSMVDAFLHMLRTDPWCLVSGGNPVAN